MESEVGLHHRSVCTQWLFVHARTVREGAHHDPGRRRNNCVVLNSSYQVCDVRAASRADDRTATSSMERTGKRARDLRCSRPGSNAERALNRAAHTAVIRPPIRVRVNRITIEFTRLATKKISLANRRDAKRVQRLVVQCRRGLCYVEPLSP